MISWRPALLSRQLRPAFALRASYSSSAVEWLAGFTNHEQQGVPLAAGTDTAAGFDLVRGKPSRCSAALKHTRPHCFLNAVAFNPTQARMHRLLDRLGAPQAAWPAVHVAGTKGKGSTVAMLAGVLRESGYRVGSYTR